MLHELNCEEPSAHRHSSSRDFTRLSDGETTPIDQMSSKQFRAFAVKIDTVCEPYRVSKTAVA